MAAPKKVSIDDTQDFMRWALKFNANGIQLRGGEAVDNIRAESEASIVEVEESRILSPIKEETDSPLLPPKIEDTLEPVPVPSASQVLPKRATFIESDVFDGLQDRQIAESIQQDLVEKPAVTSIAQDRSGATTPDGKDGSPLPPSIGARNLLDEPEPSRSLTPTQLKLLRRIDPEHDAVKAASAPVHTTGVSQGIGSTNPKKVADGARTTITSQSSTNASPAQQSTTPEHVRDTCMSFFDDKLAEFMPISEQRVRSYQSVNKPQAETPNTGTEFVSKFGVANLLQLHDLIVPSVSKDASHEVVPVLNPEAEAFWYQGQGSGKPIPQVDSAVATNPHATAEVATNPTETSPTASLTGEAWIKTEDEGAHNVLDEGIESSTASPASSTEAIEGTPTAPTMTPDANEDTKTNAENAEARGKQGSSQQAQEAARTLVDKEDWKHGLATGKSKTRLVILKNLPKEGLDFTVIQALIHGGSIESMTLSKDQGVAHVKFTNVEDGWQYLLSYEGGIRFKHNGSTWSVVVEDGKDYENANSIIQAYIEAGATRAIRLQHVDVDVPPRTLITAAAGTDGERKVEYMAESFRGGQRTIMFRFTCIVDAVAFRQSLLGTPSQWRREHVQFVEDPCMMRNAIDTEALV